MSISRKRKLALLTSLALGATGSAVALALMPPLSHDVGPAVFTAKARPGSPYTILDFPPLGTVRAATHPVPVTVDLTLAKLDINAVQDLIQNSTRTQDVRDEVERDLRDAAIALGIRALIIGLVAGAIVGAILPWRTRGDVAAGTAGGLVLSGLVIASVAVTFDLAAFEEPRYSGALTRAPAVLETLQRTELALSDVDSRFETAAERLSELLALASSPQTDPREETIALLHVSDIHSNPLGITLTRQLANRFDVDAVVDSGDLTSFGETIEASVAAEIRKLNVPYLYVPGNHDSLGNQTRIANIENVHLLHDETFDVAGVTLFGWRDPTYTVWDNVSTEEANEIRAQEGAVVADALEAETGVDVLVVHDRRMAEASEGLVPLVLSGHAHERDVVEGEETDFLAVGSTGATGLSFFVEAARPYEAQIVYFRGGVPAAVDYVTFEALGEEFQIDRQRFD